MLKRALEASEERMGRAVGKLLASERVTSGLQTLFSSAIQAKETFDKGVRQALHALVERLLRLDRGGEEGLQAGGHPLAREELADGTPHPFLARLEGPLQHGGS